MEVKINREIRSYKESVFFGLSLRQFFFSLCACLFAVLLYFLSSKIFSKEIVSWICIIGVLPFVGLGFFKYNNLTLEKFFWVWLKSKILVPQELKFVSENFYYDTLQNYIENQKRKELKK